MFARLSNKVMFQKPVEIRQPNGSIEVQFNNLKYKFIAIQGIAFSDVKVLPKVENNIITHEILMRQDPEIKEGMRVLYFNKTFEIKHILGQAKQKYMNVYVEEIKN